MWTMSAYKGAKKQESENRRGKKFKIPREEKRKEKTLLSGFQVEKKKQSKTEKPSTMIVSSNQANTILQSGGLVSENIASLSGSKPKISSSPFKKQPIVNEEDKRKKKNAKVLWPRVYFLE